MIQPRKSRYTREIGQTVSARSASALPSSSSPSQSRAMARIARARWLVGSRRTPRWASATASSIGVSIGATSNE